MGDLGLSDLQAAVDELLAAPLVLPVGDLRGLPAAKRLWDLVDARIAARQFEYLPENDEAYQLIEDAAGEAVDPAKMILTFALLRRRDRNLENRAKALTIFRADWSGAEVSFPEHGLTLERAGDSYVPRVIQSGETEQLGILAEIEVFVPMVEGERASQEAQKRDQDEWMLWGGIRDEYRQGAIRRAAIGSGCCVLTDQRIIGMFYDDDMADRPQTRETYAMPLSAASGEISTAILFSIPREQFNDYEDLVRESTGLTGKFLQGRVPTMNLLGEEVDLRVQPFRVIRGNNVSKPRKGEIGATVKAFCEEDPPS